MEIKNRFIESLFFGNIDPKARAVKEGGRRTCRKPLHHKALREKSEKVFAALAFADDGRENAFFSKSEGV